VDASTCKLLNYGEVGEAVSIQLGGVCDLATVSHETPATLDIQGPRVHLMRRELAERAWTLPNGDVLAGAYLVREGESGTVASWLPDDSPAFLFDTASGEWKRFERPRAELPPVPELGNWQAAPASGELSGAGDWRDGDPQLEAEVTLALGSNCIVVLTDNLGHNKGAWQVREDGQVRPHEQDAKGLFGPVTLDGRELHERAYLPHLSIERGAPAAWGADEEGPLKYFRARFTLSAQELATPDRELWLDVSPLGKGVIWVNGRNAGRFWTINGYTRYFLPKCWLREENEIVLFEEEARDLSAAQGVRLVWDRYAVAATSQL
jgi:hypothetical protein